MAAVFITMSGDDAKLRAMHDRMLADQQKIIDKYKSLGETSKKLSKEEIEALQKKATEEKAFQGLQERAKKNIASITGELEKYTAKLNDANAQKKAGLLTDEEHSRVLKKLKGDLEATDKSQSALNETKGKAQTATVALTEKTVAWLASFATAGAVLGGVNKLLTDQNKLQTENLENIKKLGKAQSGSGQNFAGMNDMEKERAHGISLRVQKETGFPDRSVLEKAAGEAYSAKADPALVEKSLKNSAKLNILRPEDVGPTAVGALDLIQASGFDDPARNTSVLLSGQKLSRTATPEAFAKNLPVVASAAAGTVPNQSREDALKESTALFSVGTQVMVDKYGDVTKSAINEYTKNLNEFFGQSTKELEKVTIRVNELTEKNLITPLEKAQIDEATFELSESQKKLGMAQSRGPEYAASDTGKTAIAKITIDVEERKARLDEMKKNATLNEREQAELAKVQTQQTSLGTLKDPGTIFGRIEQLQQNKGAGSLFAERSFGPGEAVTFYREMLDPNSPTAKAVKAGKNEVDTTTKTNDETIRQQTLTTEQRLATQAAKADAEKEMRRSAPAKAATGLIANITKDTLEDSRIGNAYGLGNLISEPMNDAMIRSSGSVTESARLAREAIQTRQRDIKGLRMSGKILGPAEVEQMAGMEATLKRIDEIEAEYNASKPKTTMGNAMPNVATAKVPQQMLPDDSKLDWGAPAREEQQGPMRSRNGNGKRNAYPQGQGALMIETSTKLDDTGFTAAVSNFTSAVNRLLQAPPRPIPSVDAARAQANQYAQ